MNDSTDPLAETLTETLPVLLTALEAMEVAQQAFHPARPESVIEFLNPFLEKGLMNKLFLMIWVSTS